MMYHISKDIPCVLVVPSQLRTAVVVWKSDHFLNRRIQIKLLFKKFLYVLNYTVHASDSRDYP